MHKFHRVASIFSFTAIALFAANALAAQTHCPPPADIHHECVVDVHGNYECNWVTPYVGWEGDDGYSKDSKARITAFTKAIWYGRYHQVNCFYQASTGKNVTMIPTWFGQTDQPKNGNWQNYGLGEKFICAGSPDTCPFIYK